MEYETSLNIETKTRHMGVCSSYPKLLYIQLGILSYLPILFPFLPGVILGTRFALTANLIGPTTSPPNPKNATARALLI
jgi:hypothetical protein